MRKKDQLGLLWLVVVGLALAAWLSAGRDLSVSGPPNEKGSGELVGRSNGDARVGLTVKAISSAPSVVTVVGQGVGNMVTGSGFFVSPAGLVVTSRHVVSDSARKYSVITADGRRSSVGKIIQSKQSDIALLRTNAIGRPWLSLEVADEVIPGQEVALVGAGREKSVSVGSVDGVNVSIRVDSADTQKQMREEGVIRIRAEVKPGSSGGTVIE